MAWLVAMNGDLAGKWFPLDAPCLVGRGPLNHVVLDDPRISRQHAKISPEEGGHVVYDLNSANGTFVDDQPVKRRKLTAGEVVRFGPFHFRFDGAGRRAQTQPHYGHNVEVRTLMGLERPAEILSSVEVTGEVDAATGLSVLEDAHRKLSTLYEFMKSIATTLNTQELVDRIVTNVFDVFPQADLVALYSWDEVQATPLRSVRRGGDPVPLHALTAQVHEEVIRKGRAILSAGATRTTAPRPRAMGRALHTPLIAHDATLGVLQVLADDEDEGFRQADLDLAAGLSTVAAMALQNARMHADSLRRQRHEQDLRLAQQLQKSFLPRQLPDAAGLTFHAEYFPAGSVGGDFYDLFRLDDRRLGILIGDVAGKGVAAALLMARITSDLRVAALAEESPAQVMARVNRILLEREQHEVFVTCIYATLDLETRRVKLANAGHPPPIWRRPGSARLLEGEQATAIGFFADAIYTEVDLELAPGDALVLATDGVLEATNAAGEQFGTSRFLESLSGPETLAPLIASRALRDVRAHVGTAPQYDDLTLLVCGSSPDRGQAPP